MAGFPSPSLLLVQPSSVPDIAGRDLVQSSGTTSTIANSLSGAPTCLPGLGRSVAGRPSPPGVIVAAFLSGLASSLSLPSPPFSFPRRPLVSLVISGTFCVRAVGRRFARNAEYAAGSDAYSFPLGGVGEWRPAIRPRCPLATLGGSSGVCQESHH